MKEHLNAPSLLGSALRRTRLCVVHVAIAMVLLAIVTIASHAQPLDSWLKKRSFPFTATNLTSLVSFGIGTKGYVLNISEYVNEVWEYDPAANTWTQKASFSGIPRTAGVGFSVGSKGYFGLGYVYSGGPQNRTDFWEFDPVANAWTQKSDFPSTPRRSAVGFGTTTKGYIGSGYSDAPFLVNHDFWEFNPGTNSWTQKANMPGVYPDDAVFAIGTKGYTNVGGSFYEFDPVANSWTFKGGSGTSTGRGFSVGARGYISAWNQYDNSDYSFHEYDQATNTWKVLHDVPSGLVASIAFGAGTKGYVGGGFIDPNDFSTATNDFWEYTADDGSFSSASCLPPNEQFALAELYRNAGGGNWTHRWTGTDESAWYGVTVTGCHVTALSLSGNGLAGTVPTVLSDLTSLTDIDLSKNSLSGSLPPDILANAITADFSGNQLDGTIPVNLNSSIQVLNLSSNKMTGNIPLQLFSLLQLNTLNLSSNMLDGNIPPEIGNLQGVVDLNLSRNAFTGTIPIEVVNLFSATHINFSSNKLIGTIPDFYYAVTDLDLSHNQLSGTVPDQFNKQFLKANLSDNLLTSMPAIDHMRYPDEIHVENNLMPFDILQPTYLYRNSYGFTFTYSPQKSFAREIVYKNAGDNVTFSPPIPSSSGDVMKWYKNGVLLPGETSATLSFASVQAGDQGNYKIAFTNPVIPDLTLEATYVLSLDNTTGVIPPEEREALLWLYYGTDGAHWSNQSNWLNNDESTWAGVTVTAGRVTAISLLNNSMNGDLPPELGNLTELTDLNLGGFFMATQNKLTGTIPRSFGNLTKLRTLNLGGTKLTGELPYEIGNLSNLVDLTLSNYFIFYQSEHLSGVMPTEISKLSKLQRLSLDGHNFSGAIPSELGNLKSLTFLNLTFNNFSGSIPASLGNLSRLESLFLQNSYNLTGGIPPELSNLSSLTGLYLNNNFNLGGSIPPEFSQLTALRYLTLRGNSLTGSLPAELSTLPNLLQLDVSYNLLSGSIPQEFGDFSSLMMLSVGANQLSGAIPPELGQVTTLRNLYLNDNQLSSSLPDELSTLVALQEMNLSNNQLSGSIPAAYQSLANLRTLYLNHNQFSGTIPKELGALTNLQQFYANENQLTGSIPPELSGLVSLRELGLSTNQLTGTVPAGLSSSLNLSNLYLAGNQFTGTFPASFGGLANLRYVHLQGNQFTDIPAFTSPKNELKVENNLLDFGDLEPNAGKGGYTYNPQGTILPGGSVNSNVGCLLTIPFTTPGSSNQYQWYKDGSLIPGATSQVFSLTNGYSADAGNYTVSVTNTSITGLTLTSANWVVSVGGTPITPPTATDGIGCSGSTILLSAAGAVGAQQYRWYTLPAGGSSLASTATYTTPALGSTTNYYVTVFEPVGSCESTRVTVIAQVGGTTPITSGAQSCGPGALNLNATGGSAGQYRWYTVATGGTALPGEVNANYTTSVLAGTSTFYVSIDNGSCESSRIPVTATINLLPSAPPVMNGSSCGPGIVSLSASGAVNGQYRWYDVPSGGTPLSGEVNSTFITPSISSSVVYYVSVDDGTCEGARSSVTAAIVAPPAAPSVTPGSGCSNTAITVSAAGATAGQYRWYASSSGGTALPGETGADFNSPPLAATTTYFVAINNGCEGPRSSVVATVRPSPAAPVANAQAPVCSGSGVNLSASGGSAGQYRWYDGATLISGESNGNYTTPQLQVTKIYSVSVFDGMCESQKTSVTATVQLCRAPIIAGPVETAFTSGFVTVSLSEFVTDPDGNLDMNSFQVVGKTAQGANASINNSQLSLDYSGISFPGSDLITIKVCDQTLLCTEKDFVITFMGDVEIFNALSPNGDGKNDSFIIQNIEVLPHTKQNKVTIINRWGEKVWEIDDYDNKDRVFTGAGRSGNELPSGTYFYRIHFSDGQTKTGFLSLNR